MKYLKYFHIKDAMEVTQKVLDFLQKSVLSWFLHNFHKNCTCLYSQWEWSPGPPCGSWLACPGLGCSWPSCCCGTRICRRASPWPSSGSSWASVLSRLWWISRTDRQTPSQPGQFFLQFCPPLGSQQRRLQMKEITNYRNFKIVC